MNDQKNIPKNIEQLQHEIEQLKNTVTTYKILSENADIGIIKGKFTDRFQVDFINKEALEMFGFTQKQFEIEVMRDAPVHELFEDFEIVRNKIEKILPAKKPVSFKNKIKRRDGLIIWVEGSVNIVEDKDGDKFCIFTFRFLANSQPKSKDLVDLQVFEKTIKSGILLCKLDENYTIIYANEKIADMLGYTYEEMQSLFGSGFADITAKEDWTYLTEEVAGQLENNDNFYITYKLVKKNGEKIWIEDRASIIVREGQEDVMQCIITDVTSQKEKEEALLISEKRHELVMKYSGLATFDYDIRTKKMTLHPFDVAEFNFPTVIDDAVETIVNSGMIFPKSVNNYRELFRRVEAGDLVSEDVISGTNADGESGIYELNITNIFDDRGNQLLAVGVKRDITEKFQLQKENEFANTLVSDKRLAFEANITKEKVISYDAQWAEEVTIENIDTSSYRNFINTMSKGVVHLEDAENVINYLSVKSIMNAFKRGKQLIPFIYRRRIGKLGYRWFESTVNIIKDELSEDINIRCYIMDVNEKKEKELAMLEEQKFYKNMMSKATLVYTVNVSKDKLISGYETWCKTFNVETNNNYSQLMEKTSKKEIFPADQIEVQNTFFRKNIIKAYQSGKDQLICVFRLKNESGSFAWTRSTMNLLEDPLTGNIIGFSYTENIDEDKKKELQLIYKAEHDTLTDMYNKDCTEKHISKFLAISSEYLLNHAFLIIDIDHFKAINDNFGHAFGDAILSQVAGKISKLFREEDILGRIGGDEFVVFIKNIQNETVAIKKAQEICESIIDVFARKGTNYKISASIGIAFYNDHGSTYKELYLHSDSALYSSKQNGRNQYTVYSSQLKNTESAVKEIDSGNSIESKTFASNITEYVFRILHEAHDKGSAINSVLELIGKYYNMTRAYIFEESADGKFISNTYEWHNGSVLPRINNLESIPYNKFESYMGNFNSKGIFHMTESSKISSEMKKILKSHDTMSLLQYAIIYEGKNKGFIGFDECECVRIYAENDISDLHRISHILGMFISETQILKENIDSKELAMSIVNGLESYAYVCDPKTHDILFINDKAKKFLPEAKIGNKCYRAFWNRKKPCEDCPMKCLENGDTNTLDLYNDNLDIWIKATATYIKWIDDKQVCLVNSVDITEYKK